MHDPRFTKDDHRKLRDLAGTAHERELSAALRELHKRFAEFERGAIDAFELKDDVHKFHDGAARELWKRYDEDLLAFTVAQALHRGILSESEVPEKVIRLLGVYRSDAVLGE